LPKLVYVSSISLPANPPPLDVGGAILAQTLIQNNLVDVMFAHYRAS
jgi:hypothetical protein